MKTIEKLAIRRIESLAKETKHVLLQNHKDMGEYCRRDSAFAAIGSKLDEIQDWAEALRNET